MAAGDVYITWKEETATRGVINLTHHKPDSLSAQDKIDMVVPVDGGALVQSANWSPPAGTSFYSKFAVVDPTTEVSDEITSITWEDRGIALSYATFRTLFTAQEKVDIDNQIGLDATDTSQCISYIEDLKSYETAECLCLDKTEVDTIVNWFETKSLIGAGRAATILAGTTP